MNAFRRIVLGAFLMLGLTATAPAETYTLDDAHSGVTFKIGHLGISTVAGRFNDVAGEFTLDKADPTKASFGLTIKADSVDTNNKKRDDHLRSPDFFNVKQFPTLTFKSKSVKAVEGGYEVTGDLTLHGTTKPVTLLLKGGATAEFPKGVQRIGFSSDLVLKRSDFEMKTMAPAISDDVAISISFEGVKK
jgi:polyisoprenoid-binding protein YceI